MQNLRSLRIRYSYLFFGAIFLLFWLSAMYVTTPRKVEIVSISASPVSVPSPSVEPELLLPAKVPELLKQAFSTDKDFSESSHSEDITFIINVFPYTPGKKIYSEYYQHMLTFDMDREYRTIRNLKYGKQFARIDGPFYVEDNSNDEVEFKRIGNRDFGYYSTSFAPAGTDGREYFTYNSDKKTLVYLSLYFYSTSNNLERIKSELDPKITSLQFPQKYMDVFDKFEQEHLARI